jgi:ATP-dependent DNA ligase
MSPEKIDMTPFKYDMKDMDFDNINLSEYDICDPKFDGWFTLVRISKGRGFVITSGGEEKLQFDIALPDCLLICEWIHGTNWAQTNKAKEKFVAHDCLEFEGKDIRSDPRWVRFDWLIYLEKFADFGSRFIRILETPSYDWTKLWEICVINSGFEGIVFKNSNAPFNPSSGQARLKKIATMNYVLSDFKEGTGRLEGTLGAIEGSLVIDNKLVKVCTVGGGFSDDLRDEIWFNKEQYIGKVFEARGKILFTSGALRHPAFTKWRDDVDPKECTLRSV